MKLIGKDNKPLVTEGVDEKTVAFITGAFEGLEDQVASAVTSGIKPLTDSIATISETIEKLPASEENKPEDQSENKPAIKDADNAVLAALAKITERLDKNDADSAAANEASSSLKLTAAYFEKNHPTVQGKEVLIKRIAAAKPKDDDAVKALLDDQRKEMNAMMGEGTVDKMFSADVNAEGGKEGERDDTEAEIKTKLDSLNSQLQKAG